MHHIWKLVLVLSLFTKLGYGDSCRVPCGDNEYWSKPWLFDGGGVPRCLWRPSSTRKVFVVGLPKAGTSSVHFYLKNLGLNVQQHRVPKRVRGKMYIGAIMCENMKAGVPVVTGLTQYDGLTQMDVLHGCGKQGCKVDCWPQIDMLEVLDTEHPGSLYILNQRKPERFAASVISWNNLAARIRKSNISNFKALEVQTGQPASSAELVKWYNAHTEHVRNVCAKRGMWCVEVDIENETGGFSTLHDALGCPHEGNPWKNQLGNTTRRKTHPSRNTLTEHCSCQSSLASNSVPSGLNETTEQGTLDNMAALVLSISRIEQLQQTIERLVEQNYLLVGKSTNSH